MNETTVQQPLRPTTATESLENASRSNNTENVSSSDEALGPSLPDSSIRKATTTFDDSDSDDDDLGPMLSGFDNLNLPAKMKRLMQGVNLDKGADSSEDDDDDDILADNTLFRTPAAVKTVEVRSMLKQPPSAPAITEKAKKQRSKKQPPKRPKQKASIDSLAEPSSSSNDSEAEDNSPKSRKSSKKRTLAETLEFLAESSDDSQDESMTPKRDRPPKRAMSKRAQLLMYQETQRLARSSSASLSARQGKLAFGGLLERLKSAKDTSTITSIESPDRTEKTFSLVTAAQNIEQEEDDDDDDDLEVVGGPSLHLLPSPEQNRFHWQSPTRKPQLDLNRQLQQRIAKEIMERRREAEERARARGEYKNAQESAEKQLEREREAKLIDSQVKQHLMKNATRNNSDDESVPDEEDEEEELEPIEYPDSEIENEETNENDTLIPDEENDGNNNNTKKRRRIIFSDEEDENDNNEQSNTKQNNLDEVSSKNKREKPATYGTSGPQTKINTEYLDAEAEESEDEFYGAGGPDDPDGEDLDVYEQDGMLVDKTDEHVDEAALRSALNSQLAESDKHMVDRILKDIMSGGLRRQKAAKEAGFILDDYNIFDDQNDDLVALRRAAAERRRRIQEESGDVLAALAKNPKTAAFAKAALPIPDESDRLEIDREEKQTDDEDEDDEEEGDKMAVDSEDDQDASDGYSKASPNVNTERTRSRSAWMDWIKPRRPKNQAESTE